MAGVPSPRHLDRAAERLLQRFLASSTPVAAAVTGVAVAALVAAVLTGAAALARGPVCEAFDQQPGGAYCEALPTPTPSS